MSNPLSKLSKFRSYSYYHVLAVCNSTTTASNLARSTDESVWSHTNKYKARPLDGNEEQQYTILINGSTDATYVITNAKWSASTAAKVTANDRYTSVAVEGSLDISEPKGVVFLDQVVKCCKSLNVSTDMAVFVLKTFFVGFTDNDGEVVDHISDIPPLQFIVYDVTGSFSEQGGSYHMEFVSCAGGATRMPQYSKLPQPLSFKAASTVSQSLLDLQDKINVIYDRYFNCIKQQMDQALSGKSEYSADTILRRVKYKITSDSVYEGAEYTVSNQPQNIKTVGNTCQDPANIDAPYHSSIEDIIRHIMTLSPKVNADAEKGVSKSDGSPPIKRTYKIHTTLNTDKNDITVEYRVVPYDIPKDVANQMGFDPYTTEVNANTNTKYKDNIIHFEYIYTGKNIDILEFDMKMNMGLAFLQTATLANTYRSQINSHPNSVVVVPQTEMVNISKTGEVVPVPVFFGSKVSANAYTNTHDANNSGQALYTLAKHASLEVVEVTMKIVGNLNLLYGTNNYSDVATHADRQADDAKEYPLNDFGYTPAFATVKIKMPRNNDDISLFRGDADENGADYATDFWFNGYYYIIGTEHMFEDGTFSQNLQLMGIPLKGILENKKEELDFSQTVTDCFSKESGCAPSSSASASTKPSAVATPFDPSTTGPGTSAKPETLADISSHDKTTRTPENVAGWSRAAPEVRDAIMHASEIYQIDTTTMAQMCAHESGFDPAIGNKPVKKGAPSSSAKGLFQIVKGTWDATVNSPPPIPGVPPGTSFENASDPAMNALVAAKLMRSNQDTLQRQTGIAGGSQTVGDKYMAHFLGATGAAAVINAIQSGSPNMTVHDAYVKQMGAKRGEKAFAQLIRYNSTIVKPDTTVTELRNERAKAVSGKMKSGIPVAGTTKKTTNVSNATTGVSADEIAMHKTISEAEAERSRLSTARAKAADRLDKSVLCPKTESGTEQPKDCNVTAAKKQDEKQQKS